VDLAGVGYCTEAGCCKHDNEVSGYTNIYDGRYLDGLSDYRLFK
jgi:hypothetical protein